MKTGLPLFLFLCISSRLTTPLGAQTIPAPVASEVAGFASFDVAGEIQPGKPQLSLKAIGLIRPLEYQGTAELVRAKVLTDKQATWTANQFNPAGATVATATHYVEITTGPLAGAMFDILVTDAVHQTLTLAQIIPAKVGVNPGFRVRAHWTIASLLGSANEAGFQAGDESTADLIAIYNGKTYDRYYFSNAPASAGWRRVGGGNADASKRQIYPDDGLTITRHATGGVSPLITGVVKQDRTLIPVQKGLNLVANVYQAPLTLAASQLYTGNLATGLRPGETAATADSLLLFNGTGYDTYYYQKSTRHSSGWRRSPDVQTDAGATVIPVGSAFAIQRRSVGFNWIAPAPVAKP